MLYQPAHPLSLISAFDIRFMESIISKLATCGIFLLVSVAEEACLSLAMSETPKTGFVTPKLCPCLCKKSASYSFASLDSFLTNGVARTLKK